DTPLQAGPDALARHLDDAELRDAQDFGPGAIAPERFAERILDLAPMHLAAHVDEVVDDHAAEIAQAQLTSDFLGGVEVHLERGLLGVVIRAETAAVHV